jgi:hypothetical protein
MIKYIVIGLIVVVAVGAYASRDTLKTYFQTGDVPNQEEFSDTIDSALNIEDDGVTADEKTYNPTKEYTPGDTSVKSESTSQAKVQTVPETQFSLNAPDPVTFRWTPLVPKPQEPVTYRLKVWQLMQGQNSTDAMRTNQPIVTKDVADISEVTVSSIYTGPCRPPYLCEFIWSVEVLKTGSTGAAGASGATAEPSTGTR